MPNRPLARLFACALLNSRYILIDLTDPEATMFRSFFPNPKVYFTSFLLWAAIVTVVWYSGAKSWGAYIGLPPMEGASEVATVFYFATPDMIWFYIYFAICIAIFAAYWFVTSPHPWQRWSVLVSAFILFTTEFSVQTSVALNNWRGLFFNMVQKALTPPGGVTQAELWRGVFDFIEIAFVWIAVLVISRFVVSHYIFRWRSAMNEHYADNWQKIRAIEGASQRVQDDTMRFASTMESLAVSAIDAVLTLIAFLPILYRLSAQVPELPLVGAVPGSLVWAALAWSMFGTVLLVVAGIRLPGLYFNNQKVEAAFRKELVIGEDDASRAAPPTLGELFSHVRRNYFRLYFHYAYFNVARYFYLQTDNVFAIMILVPTIAAGKITWGFFQQTLSAFGQVSESFQFLVKSWTTIVELQSIHKRLRALDAVIDGGEIPEIDRKYHEEKASAPAQ